MKFDMETDFKTTHSIKITEFKISAVYLCLSPFLLEVTHELLLFPFELKKQRLLRHSSVNIVTSYGLDGPGPIPSSATFFSSTQCPDRLWGPPSLRSNGYQKLFLHG
jgi:hypothetical protein